MRAEEKKIEKARQLFRALESRKKRRNAGEIALRAFLIQERLKN